MSAAENQPSADFDVREHLRTVHRVPITDDVPDDAAAAYHLGRHDPLAIDKPDHSHDADELVAGIPALAQLRDLIAART